VLRRSLQLLPTVIIVVLINFTLIHLTPGDPAIILAGEAADPAFLARLREEFGLDRPIHEQVFAYLMKIISGDLGYSYVYRQSVADLILSKLPNTILLTATSLALASLIGVIIGAYASSKVYSLADNTITGISLMGYSLPIFWFGQILVVVFALYLNLFPAQGMVDPRTALTGSDYVANLLHHLFLPVVALMMWQVGLIARLTRASMLEILAEDYIVTARSKGLYERVVIYKHALRNALLPVITIIGMNVGLMFAGSVLVETVFAWPGIGRLMFMSILSRDYPVIMGVFIVVSVMVVLANLVTDVLYGVLDPRVRYG